MASQPRIGADGEVPLRGAKKLAKAAYGSDEPSDVKRLYYEAPSLPIFRLKPRGPLHGYASQLRKHYETLSARAAAQAEAIGTGAAEAIAEPTVIAKAPAAKRPLPQNQRSTQPRSPPAQRQRVKAEVD